MQVWVCWYQHVLVVLDIVGDGGRGGVGQLGQGGARPAVHGDRGVVVLDLPGDVVQVVNTKLRTFHLLPPSRQALSLQGVGPVSGLAVVVNEVLPAPLGPAY